MRTYISIDLDYWLCSTNEYIYSEKDYPEHAKIKSLFKLLKLLRPIKNKIIVEEHHELLPHIDDANPDRIIHIDFHQDIAFPYRGKDEWINKSRALTLSCGSFFYWVNKRREIDFEWWYPHLYCADYKEGAGLCMDRYHQPHKRNNFIFKNQIRRKGLPKNIDLNNIFGVGIAISREWCDREPVYVDSLVTVIQERYGYECVNNIHILSEEYPKTYDYFS